MYELIFLAVLAGFALYFWNGLAAKEIAVRLGREACKQRGLQFLDETVVGSRLALKRNAHGMLCWQRRFAFEFAVVGDTRYRGAVEMLGRDVLKVDMEPHEIPDSSADA